MKMQQIIKREDLSDLVGRLENFLRDQLYAPQLWPIEYLEVEDIANFINALYLLSWECTSINARKNMPSFPVYRNTVFYSGDFTDMIQITRQLVQCCDEWLIEDFRDVTIAEQEIINLLRQLHHAMIGHYYFQHPGLETVSAHKVRFSR